MRSFPILWQLTHGHNHISVHAHTEFRFLLLSFNPEQRAPGVINQLASETQLERKRQIRFHLHRVMWDSSSGLAHFSFCEHVYLSVCSLDYFYKAFSYCVFLYMRQTNNSRKSLYSSVFGCAWTFICVWSSYLREAAHVDHNELRWFHRDLTQLVQRKLSILSRHHDVIKSS